MLVTYIHMLIYPSRSVDGDNMPGKSSTTELHSSSASPCPPKMPLKAVFDYIVKSDLKLTTFPPQPPEFYDIRGGTLLT